MSARLALERRDVSTRVLGIYLLDCYFTSKFLTEQLDEAAVLTQDGDNGQSSPKIEARPFLDTD